MSEPADVPEPSDDSEATPPPGDVTTATLLLDLQRVDTDADLAANRRQRLVEREQLSAATDALGEWERARTAMRRRIDELSDVIERSETGASEVATHKRRLDAQMKTVIAPREAEALMHEIAALDDQTDALETSEIEALEEQSDVDDRLSAHLRVEETLRDAVSSADVALQNATSAIDAEVEVLDAERDDRRRVIGDQALVRYDRIRASSGVAITHLVGHRCDGCHLDLSAAEVDGVKDEARAADGVGDCPNCGRMLAV